MTQREWMVGTGHHGKEHVEGAVSREFREHGVSRECWGVLSMPRRKDGHFRCIGVEAEHT